MAITPNWSILNDMPLFWDEELLGRNIHAARLHDGVPTRFALIPRHGQPQDIRWFEAAPGMKSSSKAITKPSPCPIRSRKWAATAT